MKQSGFYRKFKYISIIFTQVYAVCIIFVFIRYINILFLGLYVELVGHKSLLTTLSI